MHAIASFLAYFATACALLATFVMVYVHTTPYREFELIAQNNLAAALSLGGAVLGFSMPLAAAIFFTHDLFEMVKWALITGAVQIAVFQVMRRCAGEIQNGKVAPAVLLAAMSIATGMFNALSIS